MAWAPQRSKAYAAVPSKAYARTHGGFEPPPDPPGSVMYLVCNRRRQIWRLRPNTGGGPAFSIVASRGPLWPDTLQFKSTMVDIDGDSSGAWYMETPATTISGQVQPGGPPSVSFPETAGAGNGFQVAGVPVLHRLDGDLNLVASYIIAYSIRGLHLDAGFSAVGQYLPTRSLQAGTLSTGGSAAGMLHSVAKTLWIGNSAHRILDLPGGLCHFNFNQILAACTTFHSNGTTIGGLIQVGVHGTSIDYPSVVIAPLDKASEVIPLPGYESMLSEHSGNFNVGVPVFVNSMGGPPGTIYACRLGGLDYMARWDAGALTAYKTPANATPTDQMRPQCIGGSPGACYTTENNNEIVLRDGALNFVRRLQRAELETILGPNNPANGVSNFVFTGIGGR